MERAVHKSASGKHDDSVVCLQSVVLWESLVCFGPGPGSATNKTLCVSAPWLTPNQSEALLFSLQDPRPPA
jgi:hypothetical protein